MSRSPLAVLRAHEDMALVREIVTPEGIPLRMMLARAGDRAAAFVVDLVLQLAVVLAVSWGLRIAVGESGTWLTAAITLLVFVLVNFYFVLFEVRWQGATPGKRWLGIRVIDARGGQLETSAVLARNLVRELEVWIPLRFLLAGHTLWPDAPGWAPLAAGAWAFVFLFMPVFNKDRLRVGDMIAGTRVVMQPRIVLLPDLAGQPAVPGGPAAAAHVFSDAQLGIYGIYELQVLEGVLRVQPGNAGQLEVLRTVAEKVRAKLGYDGEVGDAERFLRDFYAAQRAHLEQKLLLGQRRADKHGR